MKGSSYCYMVRSLSHHLSISKPPGAPGTGKTLTAEIVADSVQRPLYPLTCGDIGTTAAEIESNMAQHSKLARHWNCVMLLDEADVFLSQRTRDYQQNSMVSVFLRVLSSYDGILFLTTNRVGVLDEAFRSRIHLTLHCEF